MSECATPPLAPEHKSGGHSLACVAKVGGFIFSLGCFEREQNTWAPQTHTPCARTHTAWDDITKTIHSITHCARGVCECVRGWGGIGGGGHV